MKSFCLATLFLALGTALASPRTAQRSLRVPSRELPAEQLVATTVQQKQQQQQQQQDERQLYEPTTTGGGDLCDQATEIKKQLAATNAELAEVNAQITLTEEKLDGLKDELADAQDERDMKDKYIKHLQAYPEYAAGIEALEETEAALQAALAVLTSSASSIVASESVLDSSSTYEKLFEVSIAPANTIATVQANPGWDFNARKTSISSALLATCAALEDGGADCDAAATNLDIAATALQDASDDILDNVINNGRVRLLQQAAGTKENINSKAIIGTTHHRALEAEDELEDLLREAARLTNVASSDVQSAYDMLGECTPAADDNLALLKSLEPTLNAATDDSVLNDVMAQISAVLAETRAKFDDPKGQLDTAAASISAADAKIDEALVLAEQCLADAEAECEEYVAFLKESLADTLGLAENLETLQDQLYANMLSQHEELGQMYADQTAMVAEAKELAECADDMVEALEQVEADTTAGTRKLAAPDVRSALGREL